MALSETTICSGVVVQHTQTSPQSPTVIGLAYGPVVGGPCTKASKASEGNLWLTLWCTIKAPDQLSAFSITVLDKFSSCP